MNSLIERTVKLAEEIEIFPLGNCSPSDGPDKQTAFLYSFKGIVKRFISSAKRLEDSELQNMINEIDTNPDSIIEAYDLKAEIQGVIDYINDSKTNPHRLKEKIFISATGANELSRLILNCLISESANNLPMICSGYGLTEGSIEEAYKSKSNYVYSRISHLEPKAILDLGMKMKGKYSFSELDELLIKISNGEEIGLISEFENILKVIKDELANARFTIWVAVAWFTNRDLANKLYLKKREGLDIQIILNEDDINSKLKDKLNQLFEVYWVSKEKNSLMHNKFCVIDFKTVIHGSYNWTQKAKYNKETISVIHNRVSAEEFAEQFKKLKTEIIL